MPERQKSPTMQSHQPHRQSQLSRAAVTTTLRRGIRVSAPDIADSTDVVTEQKGNRKTAATAAGRRPFPFKKKSEESSGSHV